MVKRLIRLILLVGLVAGVAAGAFWAVRTRQLNINQWFVAGAQMGVDISAYQEEVDFARLARQGVKFAYIKATEGGAYVDADFSQNWQAAAEAGMPAGAYHYFTYGVSGATQAENFIKAMGDLGEGRLIPAIDMELTPEEVMNPPEKDDVVRGLRAFIAVLEERYGVKPLIYAQQDYYDKYLAEDFADYPRWVRNVYYPVYIGAGDDWLVWQYNDRGELEGYTGEQYIDLNVVNGKWGLDVLRVR